MLEGVFIDCLHVKIRDGNVANRPICVVLGVTADGTRGILGLWAGEHDDGEGAMYWLRVLSELTNLGMQDVLIAVCDGLKYLPDSIGQVWPQTIVQTCMVHLLRNTYACASRKDWAEIAKDLKPVSPPSTACREVPPPRRRSRPRGTDSPSSATNGRNAIPRSSGSGPTPGPNSCRSCSSEAVAESMAELSRRIFPLVHASGRSVPAVPARYRIVARWIFIRLNALAARLSSLWALRDPRPENRSRIFFRLPMPGSTVAARRL